MSQLLDQLEQGARVLIVRIRSMGDCVLTTPALRLLAAHRPDLQIGVLVEPRFAGIYQGLPFVHSILPPEVAAARRFGARLCVNLHGGSRSGVLTALSGARWRAGFGHYRRKFVYNVILPRAQEVFGEERTVHTAEHVASAMFYLGVPMQRIPGSQLAAAVESPETGYYAVVHPFASSVDKTWSAANFAAAARALREERGMEPVILAGPGDDVTPFADFRVYAGRPLETVKALIRGASYFLGNDSGPAHIAAAFDIPMTVVFGPSNPEIWGPWRASKARVLLAGEASAAEVVAAAC
jgi:heptosyltransferase III